MQAQCQSWFDPDYEHGLFEFPHDELLTPPLNEFKDSTWRLPNDFVMSLKGNDSSVGNEGDQEHPWILFDWFDTVSNFSSVGSPSLGAVVLYLASNQSEAVAACSIDGRWAPVDYNLDPKDTIAIRQDSSNPMDILNGSNTIAAKDLVQMRMSLEWANTMNVQGSSLDDQSTTVIEEMLEGWSGGNFIFPEPEPDPSVENGYVFKSIDWRLSTTLGLYLTEGFARAFSDSGKGSMLYRQSTKPGQSYVRYLNDINQPALKEGYRNGKLDWVETRDPRWNNSILPWPEWAPQNGYTEVIFTIQRNGYGYGFDGLPIKLASIVLAIYVILVCTHLTSLLFHGHMYDYFSRMSDALVLAWSSEPAKELENPAGDGTWGHLAKIRKENRQLQLLKDAS